MKYYILLIYLLAFSLATEGNTAVKDSLSEALPSASSPLQKLEIMTNLMDLSRQEEQVEYAKQLYWLALEEDEDYYKEAALTEILRFYVNTDAKDSAKVYLAEAERELKGKARDFLVTYMKTIMDVRVVYYTKGEDRMKLIEKYKLRLETEKDMPVLDKISNYYLLGMANSNRVDPKNQDAIYKEVCYYMNNLIELSDNIPLRYSYLFRLNTLNILSLMEATPENRVKASLRYLNMQKEYADTKEMKKRPYTSKRHLLNAYSTLATAAETVGKDMATHYFNYFIDLNRKYPEDAAFSAEYDRYFTSLNYYKSIRDFQKAADYNDSVIYYFRHGDFQFDLTENIVLTLKDKIDCLDSLHRYQRCLRSLQGIFRTPGFRTHTKHGKKSRRPGDQKACGRAGGREKGTGNRPAKEPEPVISIPRVAHSFDLLRNLHILPPRKDQIAIQGIAGIEPAGHYRQ